MQISYTADFIKSYNNLSAVLRKKVDKQENFFKNNLLHPSLGIEKLIPKGRELWSIRVDRSYRIIFKFVNREQVIFIVVGHHRWIYKNL
jgi:mRNA-degrading endonuclease RelE of RelBE toxin-antitoxin system